MAYSGSCNGPRGLVFLGSSTASSSASITLTQTASSAYTTFYVTMTNVSAGTTGNKLQMSLGAISSGYQSGVIYAAYNSNSFADSTSTGTFYLSSNQPTTSSYNGYFYITNFAASTITSLWGAATYTDSTSTVPGFAFITGTNTANAIGSSLKFSFIAGNIATGTFSIYGVLE